MIGKSIPLLNEINHGVYYVKILKCLRVALELPDWAKILQSLFF